MKQVFAIAAATLALTIAASGAAAASGKTTATTRHGTARAPQQAAQITPILRYQFPERGYVVDLPREAALDSKNVDLTENGRGIADFTLSPLTASGLRFGVILAIDSSDSMKGAPLAGALSAARSFVTHPAATEEIGVVAFNGTITALQAPTAVATDVERAISQPPAVAYGTHIFDAVARSLSFLQRAKVSTGAIVLLSDGADVGSRTTLARVVAAAAQQHVRIFTIGLRSAAFDRSTLQSLAAQTDGAYAEATSPAQLAQIYAGLSARLASDYVLQYRSLAPPRANVRVQISVRGFAPAAMSYTAPTPADLAPYHRSLVTRFLLSSGSLLILAILVALVAAYAMTAIVRGRRSDFVERMRAFASGQAARTEPQPRMRRRRVREAPSQAQRWFANLESDLDIGQVRTSPTMLIGLTLGATLLCFVVFALISPVFGILALLVPFIARGFLRRRVAGVRDKFATQLPGNVQILASALRSGHSFAGALAVVVENADEPSRGELRRAVADDQLGIPLEEALRRVATRMESRDLEQVALVAELQRTTGGNAAEVLDVVVNTIRDREDVRRLVQTLTAQGRLARWILTGLPVVVGLGFYLIQPRVAGPMYHTTFGQVALVVAALMVATGSLLIQKIVEIEV